MLIVIIGLSVEDLINANNKRNLVKVYYMHTEKSNCYEVYILSYKANAVLGRKKNHATLAQTHSCCNLFS